MPDPQDQPPVPPSDTLPPTHGGPPGGDGRPVNANGLATASWGRQLLSVPNLITVARICAVPVLIWLILDGRMGPAFWLFVAAGVSDAVDGIIARSFRSRTKLGGYLDPIADKALLVASFIALGAEGLLPLWLVLLVVARDIIIVAGVSALTLMKERLAMQPLWISKVNTFAQIALASIVLAVAGGGFPLDSYIAPVVWLVAVTTSWSLIGYFLRGLLLIRTRGGRE